jgi:hypothetical protein
VRLPDAVSADSPHAFPRSLAGSETSHVRQMSPPLRHLTRRPEDKASRYRFFEEVTRYRSD